MKAVTSAQMRELDRRTIEEHGTPGEVLMERAGAGIAESIIEIITASSSSNYKVIAVAGHGNNGGDAFVAARILTERGIEAEVLLCSDESKIQGDALIHMESYQKAGVPVKNIQFPISNFEYPSSGGLIILDGVLGTGIEGEVRGPAADAIEFINKLGEKNLVVAIDVPSGLNADTGEELGVSVRADRTVTMGLPKIGLLKEAATEFVGSLEVVDIGIPAEFSEKLGADLELIEGGESCGFLSRRSASAHKGTFGHVLVIGGAKGFAGAPTMAAKGALRSGAGLVTVLAPESVAGIIAGSAAELMVCPAKETEAGALAGDALTAWGKNINDFDAVVVGPGMTVCDDTARLVRKLVDRCEVPLILDADALNVLEGDMALLANASCEVVITPHPGEMARLMGRDTAEVQAARVASAVEIAETAGVTVVLKGAGTIVAKAGEIPMVNRTGNPGMGTGGMGDVLAGIIAGFAAGDAEIFEAACAGVYVHGRAGDLAALTGSQISLTAGDVLGTLDELPSVFRELTGR